MSKPFNVNDVLKLVTKALENYKKTGQQQSESGSAEDGAAGINSGMIDIHVKCTTRNSITITISNLPAPFKSAFEKKFEKALERMGLSDQQIRKGKETFTYRDKTKGVVYFWTMHATKF